MTYCLAIHLKDGVVLASDTRTNAGVDHISTCRKMHQFVVPGERVIVCLSAGNLATTQSVISRLKRDIETSEYNVQTVDTMFEVAELVGKAIREIVQRDTGLSQSSVNFKTTFIVGGQIKGEPHRLFLVYPEGNFIECSKEAPFFQIGETKYGKPILDRVAQHEMSLDDGVTCSLLSLDSTLRSNVSVGLPLELMRYEAESFSDTGYFEIDKHHQGFINIGNAWSKGLRDLFESIPKLEQSEQLALKDLE